MARKALVIDVRPFGIGRGSNVHRLRVILVAGLLALIGTAIPLTVTLLLSWKMATSQQEDELAQVADEALARTLAIFDDTRSALRALAASDYEPCSPEYMEQMRELAVDSPATENLGFIRNGIVHCNLWGLAQRRIPRAPSDVILPDGIGLSVNYRSIFNERHPMMVLHLGDNTAMIDQIRFILPFHEPAVRVDLRSPGGITVATSWEKAGDPPPASAEEIVAHREGNGWSVTVSEVRLSLLGYVETAKYILIPISIFLAGLFAGLAFWLSYQRLSPRGELAQAVRNREFIAHYQPIIELSTGRCVGGEALLRWRRPDGQLVRPDLFIPLAEDTGLIQPMTDQLIDAVGNDLGDLLRRDPQIHVAINLCAADISSGRILPVLETMLDDTRIEPRQIWVEATERGFVDIDGARSTLAELRRRGHMTAIDDFGTGYSGLKYLQRLPVDALKIDKSFIDAIGTEAPTRHVTEHIIAMARELRLHVVAEGVETEVQATYLRDNKVALAQGWLFARALPADEFIAFCKHNRAIYGTPSGIRALAAE